MEKEKIKSRPGKVMGNEHFAKMSIAVLLRKMC